MSAVSPQRIPQLDALRGLAAATVVPWHMLMFFPWMYATYQGVNGGHGWLMLPIPYVFIAGHPAVILFFVLSGFVLALPQMSGCQPIYRIYAWRRFCRIWIPYAACVSAAMLGALWLGGFKDLPLSQWAWIMWTKPPSYGEIVQHAVLIDNFKSHAFNASIWSLVHEMRISLIFPLIAAMVMRRTVRRSLLLVVCCTLLAVTASKLNARSSSLNSYATTLHYCGMFIVGAVLAKHHVALRQWVEMLSGWRRIGLLMVAVIFYTSDGWHRTMRFSATPFCDLLTTGGAAALIMLALGSKALTHWFPVWLGKISYSLYLWHQPVLLATVKLGWNIVPLPALLAIGGVLSVAVATASQKWIEQPAISFARQKWGLAALPLQNERLAKAPRHQIASGHHQGDLADAGRA